MENLGTVERALTFAAQHHAGQMRKGSSLPYILHPMEAAVIVSAMTEDAEVIAAAVLHDVLEDTDATGEELLRVFGARIASLVLAESEDKREQLPKAETWKTRKCETLARLDTESRLVKIITLGDKLSNLRAIKRDLVSMGDALWQRFNQKDKAEHGWYYRSVAEALVELRGCPAYDEYCALVNEVFG